MSAVVIASSARRRRIPRLREAALICVAAVAASGLSWVAASAGIKALVALTAVIGLVTVLALVPNRSAVLQVGLVVSLVVLQHKKFGPLVLNTESGANGLDISSADVMVVLLYISWMIEGTFKREVKRALRQPIYWVPLLGLALMSVSMFAATNVYLSISQVFYMLWPYLIFFYFGARLRTRRELLTVLVALAMFAVVELVVVILQWKTGGVLGLSFLGVPTELQQRTLDIGAVGRPFGTIIHPVFLSDVLGMFALVALCVAIYVPDRRVKQAALVAVPICIAPIFLASARGPALALGVTMAVLIVFAAGRRLVSRRAILTAAGGIGVVGAAFYPKLSKLVAENFGTHHVSVEITARLQLNDVAMRMLDSSPLIGTGLNNYTQIMNNFAPFPLLFPGYPAHNLYLLQLAETGFVGFFGMVFVAMALAKVGYDLLKSYHWLARTFGAALLCILLFNFGEEMLSYSLREEVPLAVFWLIAGLALAARRIVRDETRAARRAGSPGVPRPTAATAVAERGLIRHVVVVSRDLRRRSARRRRRQALPVPAPRATRRPGAGRRPALSGGARPVARPGHRSPGRRSPGRRSPGRRAPGHQSPGRTPRPQHAQRAATRLPTRDGAARSRATNPGSPRHSVAGRPWVDAQLGRRRAEHGGARRPGNRSPGRTPAPQHAQIAATRWLAFGGVARSRATNPGSPRHALGGRRWVDAQPIWRWGALVLAAGSLVYFWTAVPSSGAPISMAATTGIAPAPALLFSALDRHTGRQGIYEAMPGSTKATLVSPNDGAAYRWPEWALGGTKIVYTRQAPSSAATNIYMANANGSDPVELTQSEWRIDQPKVSPDGRELLFAAFWPEYPSVALYSMNLQSLQVTNLSAVALPTPSFDSDPNWAPDGRITFAHATIHHGVVSNNTIWVMNADGTDPRPLTDDQYFDVDGMISPNGEMLTYASYRGSGTPTAGPGGDENPNDLKLGDWYVVVKDLRTDRSWTLNQAENCGRRSLFQPLCGLLEGSGANPTWSSNSQSLAYISILGPDAICICSVGADGSDAQVLFESRDLAINWFDWYPAARPVVAASVATATPPSEIVYGARLAGSGAKVPLAVAPADLWGSTPLHLPGGLVPIDAQWSPDRSEIAFTARVLYDHTAFDPSPPPPPGQTRHVHYVLPILKGDVLPPPVAPDIAEEQIFLLDVRTDTVRQLTTPWTEDYLDALAPGEARGNSDPDFSPDGRYVIFTNTSSLDGESFILRLDLQTGAVVNLTNVTAGAVPTADEDARYSPNGQQIAFVSALNGADQIELMGADGTDVRPLDADTFDDLSPTWSPDGTMLAYASYRGSHLDQQGPTVTDKFLPVDSRDWALVSVDLATGRSQTLTFVPDGGILQPEWAPTGDEVAFISLSPVTHTPDIFVVASSGGTPVDLQPTPYTYDLFFDWR